MIAFNSLAITPTQSVVKNVLKTFIRTFSPNIRQGSSVRTAENFLVSTVRVLGNLIAFPIDERIGISSIRSNF